MNSRTPADLFFKDDDFYNEAKEIMRKLSEFKDKSFDRSDELRGITDKIERLRQELRKFTSDTGILSSFSPGPESSSSSCASSSRDREESHSTTKEENKSEPKVHYIPVEVEDRGDVPKTKRPSLQKSNTLRNFSSAQKSMGSPFSKAPQTARKPPPAAADDVQSQLLAVHRELDALRQKVGDFPPGGNTKEYRYLDEMVTRCILRLDTIDVAGKDNVRLQRRGLIQEAEVILALLETKQAKPGDGDQKDLSDSGIITESAAPTI